MKVVLPAPFGPVSPYRRPRENVAVTSSKSTFDPNRIDTSCTEIMTLLIPEKLVEGTIYYSANLRYIFVFVLFAIHFRRDAMRFDFRRHALAAGIAAALATLPLGAAGEKIDYEAINKMKEQGLQPQNSKVMEISSWLTDVYGPRLTCSPNTQKAGEWAVAKMKEWGLQNVALEKWPDQTMFPRGWVNEKF